MTYSIPVPKGELVVTDSLYASVRKKPVLAYQDGNGICKLASFNNIEAMEQFLKLFRWKGDTDVSK